MSSSESDDRDLEENDEDSLCKYGTQLPQYEADEIPSKKPLQVEDMVVKDENGRRRFHGAFTGGFSAGYWNTVGSKEGFTPSEFKSSRNEKASAKVFKPTDFMDDEDFGEFGIAPQKIQTKDDFGASTSSAKRKREKPSDGPIPGEPVLKNLLKPVHDKAAVRILKKMGYRYGQGIGSRMTYSEKKRTAERNKRELYVSSKYGGDGSDEDDDMSDDEITFVPDDFDPFIANIKDNTFGLEYSGLRPTEPTSTQRFSLFEPFKVFGGKDNKKFSISGQAFGVGALEEEDDDIYGADNDMSKYDFVLDNTSEKRGNSRNVSKPIDASIIEGFSKATINDSTVRTYTVDIPRDYEPRNWFQRKSRFAPLSKEKVKVLEEQNKHKILGLGRHDLNPEQRGALINEPEKPPNILQKDDDEEKKKKSQEASKKMMELLNSKQFVSENSTNKEGFKPFIANPDKQDRYEKFLALKSTNEAEIEKFFNDIQPLSMSRFDSEMERKEFVQAKRMYQPLDSLMGNRFIKEADIQKEPDVKTAIKDGKEVVVIQRTKVMWKPHKTLCKLFNIPEPYGGMMFDEEEEKKKNKKKQSLFEYIGVPLNTKANFVAPQVIPRKLSEDPNRRDPEDEKRKSFLAAVEKEKSFMGQRATAKDFFDEPMLPSSSQTDKEMPKDNKMEKKEVKKVSNEQPKTELEMKVAESIHKKPEEKKDLFKAIFCDSDDDDEEKDDDSAEAIKISNADASEGTSTLTEKQKSTFIESFLSTKSASEINVLRNKSPPRGIFKSIFELGTSTSKALSNERQKEGNVEDVVEEEAYGPALPQNLINAKYSSDDSSSSSESSLDEKLLKKLKKVKSSSKEERWVEKDKVKKSKKHHKKKKSHKKSHKKHKSKK